MVLFGGWLATIWRYTSVVGQALGIGDGFYHLCAEDICGGEEGKCYGLGYLQYKCKCKTNLFIAQV